MKARHRPSASLVSVFAVLTLSLPGHADAYLFATSGVEIVVSPLGVNLWEMTLESDRLLTDGAFDLNQGFASMAYTAAVPCDGVVAICNQFDQSLTGLPSLIFAFSIILPTDPSIFTGIGNPVVIGQLTTTSALTTGVFPVSLGAPGPDFGIDLLSGCLECRVGFNGGSAPLTFVVVPEPTTALLLGSVLAALLALRRGTGPACVTPWACTRARPTSWPS